MLVIISTISLFCQHFINFKSSSIQV
jgi:hypothetical protein